MITKKGADDITTVELMENHKSEPRTLVLKIFGTPSPPFPRVIERADQHALREEMRNGLHPSRIQSSRSSTEEGISVEENCSIGSAIVDTDNVCRCGALLDSVTSRSLSDDIRSFRCTAMGFLKLLLMLRRPEAYPPLKNKRCWIHGKTKQ